MNFSGSERPNVAASSLEDRIEAVPWDSVSTNLDEQGWSTIPNLLTRDECVSIAGLYQTGDFRNRIDMARHGFGSGEYKYFSYPLPQLISTLRTLVYPLIVGTANRWAAAMQLTTDFPASHAEFIDRCHQAGQCRPTPLILQYGTGDYNCLHQDLYGDQLFPLQLVILLSEPGRDFQGGEFVLTEQRPRMQSRPMVVPLNQGDAAIFAVRQRPVKGLRGTYRVNLRHGVSKLRAGSRHALGIIFHDAV